MLKKFSIRARSRALAKNYRKPAVMVNYNEAKSIGILAPNPGQHKKVLQNVVSSLKKEGKDVHVLVYDKSKKEISMNFEYDSVRKRDISWMGKFKAYGVKKFIKSDFDYLFSLNTSPILPFESILATSNAKCRVGIYHERNQKFCDLMITIDKKSGIEELAEQMIYYTKRIK